MSDETNKRMDESLRNYAKQRRQDAPHQGDASPPPAMRRALQDEVRKAYPPRESALPASPGGLPHWLLWLVRPSGLGALGAAAALVLGMLIVRYDVPSSSSRPEWESTSGGSPPLSATAPSSTPLTSDDKRKEDRATTALAEETKREIAQSAPVPPPKPGVPADTERLLRLKDAPTPQNRELREQQLTQSAPPPPASAAPVITAPSSSPTPAPLTRNRNSTTTPAQPVTAPNIDSLATGPSPQPLTRPSQKTDNNFDASTPRRSLSRPSTPDPNTTPLAALPPASPDQSLSFRFVQTPAPETATKAATISPKENSDTARRSRDGALRAASSAPIRTEVLRSFSVNLGQEGNVVILDQDGSQYTGRLLQNAAPSQLQLRGNSAGNNVGGANASSAQGNALSPYRITAEGTNRSLKERVLVEGELDWNATAVGNLGNLQNAAGAQSPSLQRGAAPYGNLGNGQSMTNLQFRGYYQLQNQPRQQINALQTPDQDGK